jgi:hypothetical protein
MQSSIDQGKAHDLVISIQSLDRENKGISPFCVTVRCDSLGYMCEDGGKFSIKHDFLKSLSARLDKVINCSCPDDELASIGMSLYDDLFPDELKRLYWDFCEKIQNILVVSEETWIPWQLIMPHHNSEQDRYWGEKYVVSRWWPSSGILFKQIASITPLDIIAGNSQKHDSEMYLHRANEELTFLTTELNGVKAIVIPPQTLSFYNELRTGGFSAFHIACHSDYDSNLELCEICLEDGRVSAMSIKGNKTTFGKETSLFFLNTCGIARPQRGFSTATGAFGFVPALLKANVKAVICTHWDVSDEKAAEFTKVFYKDLVSGKCIGDAFQNARWAIRSAADPTWLSYTLFGDPFGRITIPS